MIASLSKFNSRRLSLPSETESKKRSMIKELRVNYRKCFTNSALSSTAKRFSPSTRQIDLTRDCVDGEYNSILRLSLPKWRQARHYLIRCSVSCAKTYPRALRTKSQFLGWG